MRIASLVLTALVVFLFLTPAPGSAAVLVLGPERALPPDHVPPGGARSPLTGLVFPAGAILRLPLGLVIDNHPAARPQSGLSRADLVVELPAEGGITRHLAFMWSGLPPRVGPVRSARDYCLELIWALDAVAVHMGGSPGAYALLSRTSNPSFNGMHMSHGFSWVDFRTGPHRVHVDTGALSSLARTRGWTGPAAVEPLGEFLEPGQLPGGVRVHRVDVSAAGGPFEPVSFRFDPARGRYERSIGGVLLTDNETGERLLFSSVMILHTTVRTIPGDPEGRVSIDLRGPGRADVFTRGYYRQGVWSGDGGFPAVTFPDGTTPLLSPGPTWIMFVRAGSGVNPG